MQQRLRIERNVIYPRETFFKMLELPFEALNEFFRNLPFRSSSNSVLNQTEDSFLDNLASNEKSLSEQIVEDLAFERLDDLTERVAEYIAYNLDERGKMLVSVAEVCDKFGVEKHVVFKAMEAIRNVGPNGILEGQVVGYGQNSNYIEPDLEIRKDYSISVKEFNLPVPQNLSSHESKLFIFFHEALNKRREYLYQLGQIVVENNRAFLDGARPYPLKIRITEVANRLNLSVSAVSKLLKGKYIKTSVGIFPLKIFFGRSVEKEYLFCEMLRILSERPKITDRQLTFELAKSGIHISRRTANKYRNMLREKLTKGEG